MFLSNEWKAELSKNETGFQLTVSGFARTGMHTILPEIFKVYPPGFDQRILQLGISNVVDNPHGILHEVHYSEQITDCEEYLAVNIFVKNELLIQISISGKEQCN